MSRHTLYVFVQESDMHENFKAYMHTQTYLDPFMSVCNILICTKEKKLTEQRHKREEGKFTG